MSDVEAQAGGDKRKLTAFEQAVCAWPLVLVTVGGAIGGACGGIAWALNTKIMSGAMPAPVRYLLVFLSGLGAGALYLLAVFALATMFPDLFGST